MDQYLLKQPVACWQPNVENDFCYSFSLFDL